MNFFFLDPRGGTIVFSNVNLGEKFKNNKHQIKLTAIFSNSKIKIQFLNYLKGKKYFKVKIPNADASLDIIFNKGSNLKTLSGQLKLNLIKSILLLNFEDFEGKRDFLIFNGFFRVDFVNSKIEGKTRFIGYSGDNEGADWAVKSNLFDTLQTSYSIADQRARTKNVLSEATERNMGIIAKRPIGNAALLGVKHHINSTSYEFFKASAYDEYFKRLFDITKNNNIDINEIDPIELSMAFSLNRKEIHVLIIGSKNLSHVEENLNIMRKKIDNFKDIIRNFEITFEKLDKNWRQLT